MAKFRVLALDSGGVRGIMTTVFLRRLSRAPGLSDWIGRTDLFAGTSIGGFTALCLAMGQSPSRIQEFQERSGPKIFVHSVSDGVKGVGKMFRPEYRHENMERELRGVFGEIRLGDLRRKVLVPLFCLDNEAEDPRARRWEPVVIHNFPWGRGMERLQAYKVAVYACSVPTYFASLGGYIDGGLFAANPAMSAIALSQDLMFPGRPSLDEVVVLSLGTGSHHEHIAEKELDWGYAQWARPLLHILRDASTGIVDSQCRQMLGERYHRVDPGLPAGSWIPMDAVDRLGDLVEHATHGVDLEETIRWIRDRWL